MSKKIRLLFLASSILLLLFFSFFLGWKLSEKRFDLPDIPVVSGELLERWDFKEGTYKTTILRDKETAVNVAIQIFNGMDKSETTAAFIPRFVAYNKTDGVWIVTFAKDPSERYTGCCSIALKEEDGQVLRIWFGE